jgi:VanZ family protein
MFNNNKVIKFLSWLFVINWLLLIYYFSAQPAYDSNNLSNGLTESIIETVEKVSPEKDVNFNRLNHLIRKNAHFFIYLVLAVLLLNAFRNSGVFGIMALILTFVISVSYAISDELHQLFVPGRGGQVKDVFIDCAGTILGLSIYKVLEMIIFTMKNNNT